MQEKKCMYVAPYLSLNSMANAISAHNMEHPDKMILKDDIVDIIKDEEGVFLIYYA